MPASRAGPGRFLAESPTRPLLWARGVLLITRLDRAGRKNSRTKVPEPNPARRTQRVTDHPFFWRRFRANIPNSGGSPTGVMQFVPTDRKTNRRIVAVISPTKFGPAAGARWQPADSLAYNERVRFCGRRPFFVRSSPER